MTTKLLPRRKLSRILMLPWSSSSSSSSSFNDVVPRAPSWTQKFQDNDFIYMGSTICLTLWSKVEIKLKKLNELETSITAATSRTLPSIISWNAEIDLASRPSTTSLSINLMMHECDREDV
ncbi:hypothetical protein SDJN02_27505, partial [Cucurbita argyrosperma subsp. argyrosperma]